MDVFDGAPCPKCNARPTWNFYGKNILESIGLTSRRSLMIAITIALLPALMALNYFGRDSDAVAWAMGGILVILFFWKSVPMFFCPNCQSWVSGRALEMSQLRKPADPDEDL